MPADTPRYRELPHTADVAIQACGHTIAELFENAAYGMFQIIAGGVLESVLPEHERSVEVTAFDRETLLVDWLTELLILHETTGELVSRTQVAMPTEMSLHGRVWSGRPSFAIAREIKAVTYHELRIERGEENWQATIVFDV